MKFFQKKAIHELSRIQTMQISKNYISNSGVTISNMPSCCFTNIMDSCEGNISIDTVVHVVNSSNYESYIDQYFKERTLFQRLKLIFKK